jgi:hypothetical protein
MAAGAVYDVGDPVSAVLTLEVTPDVSTVVNVQIIAPDGSTASGTVTGPTVRNYATAFTVMMPGDYVVVWTVTGTGAGITPQVINVNRLPIAEGRPDWSPFLSDVADHVPTRTVDMTVPGSDLLLMTFNANTQPNGDSVQRIIDGAVSGILSIVPTIVTGNHHLAKSAASWRAAADVELAYPERNANVNVYEQLNSRAQLELERLIQAAETGGGGAVATFPVWSFPPPVPWGDDYL